jgi:hypothetical protein
MSTLTVGAGEQFSTVSTAIAAAQPGDTFDLDTDGQALSFGSGTGYSVVLNGNDNLLTMAGYDTVTLTGSGNVVATGTGQNVIYEESAGGNTIVTRAPQSGANKIYGDALQNGDTLDLSATFGGTNWDGNLSDAAQYLSIKQTGTVATLYVSEVPGGPQYLVATFENAPLNLTVSQILAQSVITPEVKQAATAAAQHHNTLTVGVGEEYATITDAVAASQAGDTILVNAGTYVTKDLNIDHDLTIEGVGGPVDVVAPAIVSKGLFVIGTETTAPNVTLEGLTLSGAKAGSGNGAGVRYQTGNLTLINDTIENNQDGLLATPFVEGVGSVIVQGTTFDHNGAGDGQSHNIYIGYINSFTMTDSVSEDANVGHEVKSRAYNNTIEDNQIIDGSTGTASYSIDLPNGGNDIIQGNTIEKGPDASAGIVIHIGGPEMLDPQNSVTITNNTVINDYGAGATFIYNQTQTPVTASGNTLEGSTFTKEILGYGTISASENASGTALANVVSNDFGNPKTTLDYRTDPAAETLTLTKASETVQGGAGHLTITTSKGQETVIGGSGGITLNDTVGAFVTTMAGSTNQITLGGGGSIQSAGNDTITMPTKGEVFVDVTGTAVIYGSSGQTGDPYFIGSGGVATLHEQGGNDVVFVRQGGSLTLDGTNKMLELDETDATANFDFVNGGVERSGSFVGGCVEMNGKGGISIYSGADTTAVLHLNEGTYTVSDAGGATIYAGAASVTVNTPASATAVLSFIGGSGTSKIYTGAGAAQIVAGSGSLTVTDQSKVGVEFDFNAAAAGGTTEIAGYNAARDKLVFQGFDGNAIASQSVSAGALHLTLQNQATVILDHTTHL